MSLPSPAVVDTDAVAPPADIMAAMRSHGARRPPSPLLLLLLLLLLLPPPWRWWRMAAAGRDEKDEDEAAATSCDIAWGEAREATDVKLRGTASVVKAALRSIVSDDRRRRAA